MWVVKNILAFLTIYFFKPQKSVKPFETFLKHNGCFFSQFSNVLLSTVGLWLSLSCRCSPSWTGTNIYPHQRIRRDRGHLYCSCFTQSRSDLVQKWVSHVWRWGNFEPSWQPLRFDFAWHQKLHFWAIQVQSHKQIRIGRENDGSFR